MKQKKNTEKINLHPRNLHRTRYDFEKLSFALPELKSFVFINEHNTETIDFSEPEAVKALNKAILISDYGITSWDIPSDYLCPPIPGRADYVHYIADILAESNNGVIPTGENVGIGRSGKYLPTVGRIDGVYGDRNLVCSCLPIEELASN
jgi:23S rRNA (adenine1618-N6)-methyltransferase